MQNLCIIKSSSCKSSTTFITILLAANGIWQMIIQITSIALPLAMKRALRRATRYLISDPYGATYNTAKGRQQPHMSKTRQTPRRHTLILAEISRFLVEPSAGPGKSKTQRVEQRVSQPVQSNATETLGEPNDLAFSLLKPG